MYGSEDGSVWAPIALASTNPAPAVGGRQMLSELLPAESLPAGVNRVKLVLGRGTELAQVAIMGGRSGPACLAPTPAARANTLAGFLPGTSPAVGARLDRHGRRKVTLRVALLRRRRRPARGRVPSPWGRIPDRHHSARLPARRHRPRRLAPQPPAPIRPRERYERSEAGCSSRRLARCSSSDPGV